MRVLQINSVYGSGSTGRIALAIHNLLREQGHESFVAYGRGSSGSGATAIRVGSDVDVYMHVFLTRLFDAQCRGSRRATRDLVQKIDEINPDVIHLHNVHGYYLNMNVLFRYLREITKPIVWTLHDCWAFTGHCAYFDYVGCNRWKHGCYDCPQIRDYPSSMLIGRSRNNYDDKKALFTSLRHLTLVAPSNWLAGLVKESFLSGYPVRVINNGVDQSVFKPTPGNFRQKYGLEGKFVVLGVASVWARRKGLQYFLEISKYLPGDTAVVIVGVNKKQSRSLPDDFIAIEKTDSVRALAEIYSAADVFVNPTLEENFPTTNLEALACGTPVITFRTGGSPESVGDCGHVVDKGDVAGLLSAINLVRERTKSYYHGRALERAARLYRDRDRFQDYVEMYEGLLDQSSRTSGDR